MSSLSLDHVCFEVEDMEASESFWGSLLGVESTGISTIHLGKGNGTVQTAFFEVDPNAIELSQHRLEGDWKDSPLMRGPGFHHISFSVPSLNAVLEELSSKGCKPIPHFPRETPHGRIAFLDPSSTDGILIELKEG
jgi:methylmalonyl-CoA epimerase